MVHGILLALDAAHVARALSPPAPPRTMTHPRSELVTAPGFAADVATLFKARIAVFVFVAALVGGLVAPATDFTLARVLEAAAWVTVSAAAASAFNQVLERDTDRLMQRTRNRPVAAGRMAPRDVLLVASLLAVAAVLGLSVRFGLVSGLLTLGTLFAYVVVYTPLKRHSTLNTLVGAVPGAAPPLLGYAAIAGSVDGWALILFAIVFVWQFPHFMAIAWLYREDYTRGGLRMLASESDGERMAARSAFMHGLVLLPVCMLPSLRGDAGLLFTVSALVLSVLYLAAAARFAVRPERSSARLLLYTSLVHLPLVLVAVVLDPRTGALARLGWTGFSGT
ncbi:MAG: Protoheme farnesyltransferase 1 [Planctomycetota bacterium]